MAEDRRDADAATPQQIARLSMFYAALGRGPVPGDITREEATVALVDAARLFNLQARGHTIRKGQG